MKDIIFLLIWRLFQSAAARTGSCAPATAVFVVQRHSDGTPWRRRETKKQTAFIASLLKRRSNYMLSVGAAEALLWAH